MKVLNPIAHLVEVFRSLPGVGPRMAERLTYHIIKSSPEFAENLASSVLNIKKTVSYCVGCSNFTDLELCDICSNTARDRDVICVVEEVNDLIAVEKCGYFTGLYHVLHGSLSPLDGIGPKDLTIIQLLERIKKGSVNEIILATNPTVEGEATATYLHQLLKPFGMKITRIAQGLPRGGDLEYADGITLKKALEGRKEM